VNVHFFLSASSTAHSVRARNHDARLVGGRKVPHRQRVIHGHPGGSGYLQNPDRAVPACAECRPVMPMRRMSRAGDPRPPPPSRQSPALQRSVSAFSKFSLCIAGKSLLTFDDYSYASYATAVPTTVIAPFNWYWQDNSVVRTKKGTQMPNLASTFKSGNEYSSEYSSNGASHARRKFDSLSALAVAIGASLPPFAQPNRCAIRQFDG